MEQVPSGEAHAAAATMKPMASAADAVLRVVEDAAAQLGPVQVDAGRTPQEVLSDQASREAAARWRAGSAPRRFTATLARLATAVQSWTAPGSRPEASGLAPLAPVRPRPLREPTDETRPSAMAAWGHLAVCLARNRIRTLVVLFVILMFPRLLALSLALIIRLMMRAVVALASHLVRELMYQTMTAASELEEMLIGWLSYQMGSSAFPQPQQVPSLPPAGSNLRAAEAPPPPPDPSIRHCHVGALGPQPPPEPPTSGGGGPQGAA